MKVFWAGFRYPSPPATAFGDRHLLLVAFLAHGEWSVEGLRLLSILLIDSGVGVLFGQRLALHLPEQRLRQGFDA